jgi:hypothetical protein
MAEAYIYHYVDIPGGSVLHPKQKYEPKKKR